MLRAFTGGKIVDDMQEQVDNGSREMENSKKDSKEMLGRKNNVTEVKNALMDSLLDWTWGRGKNG